MKLHEKRVKELLKGNAIVEKAIELIKAEKSDMACTIRAFHRTAKQMVEVKKLLSSAKFKNEMKAKEIKGMTMKKLVPIAVGKAYPTFCLELQVAKVTLTQLNAFIKAVKEDDSISVSKQGLVAFVKGKKRAKTDSVKPTAEPTNAGGGKEETKDGGEESNIIFGCHFTPFGLVKAKGSLKITKGGIENADKITPEQLLDMRNALKFAEAQLEKLASKKTIKRAKK